MRSAVCLCLVFLACSPQSAPGFADPPADGSGDPAALLERLKARDAEFDNRSVETEKRWVEEVSPRGQAAARQFDARRLGRRTPGPPPEDAIPADFDQPHRLRQLLTVRSPALTIERLEDLEPPRHPEYLALPNRGCRWSSAGGIERVWAPETNALHVLGPAASDGLLRWQAHMLEWSCGYGLAGRLEKIDSVRARDGRLTVKGRMRLLGDDDSRVMLHLDRDLIVRRAVISVPAREGKGSDAYVVDTRGTVRPAGCPPVAESGRFRRILKPAGKPESVDQDYEVRFIAASARLTDDQYDRRTRIEPRAGAITIIDAGRKKD